MLMPGTETEKCEGNSLRISDRFNLRHVGDILDKDVFCKQMET